jgi:hypothetical protein
LCNKNLGQKNVDIVRDKIALMAIKCGYKHVKTGGGEGEVETDS